MNQLKAFARLDPAGKIIAGTTVYRKNMPKVGRWIELEGITCCTSTSLEDVPEFDFPITSVNIGIECDGDETFSAVVTADMADATAMVYELNKLLPIGAWYNEDGTIKLSPKPSFKSTLCPDGELTLAITN